MPVIAVGVAVAADVAAGVAVAASGIAAISLTTALEVVAAVGATVSAIGTVTHNKALTMVGAGLGLVGGIGALASSAGVFGAEAASGAALFGASPAASTADAAATAGGDTISSLSGDVATSSAMTGDAGGGWIPSATDAASTAALPETAAGPAAAAGAAPSGDLTLAAVSSAPDTAADTTSSILNGGQGVTAPATDATTLPPTAFTPAAGGVPAPGTGSMTPISDPGAGTVTMSTPDAATQGALADKILGAPQSGGLIQSPSSLLGKLLDFGKNNPMLSYGVLQAGGQFLSGLTSTLTPAQVGALNAQAAANQAVAGLTTQQTQNLAQPKSVATLAPVTGTPNPIIALPTAGMINSAPRVNVTGAPT